MNSSRRSTTWRILALTGAVLALRAAPARACSPVEPGFSARTVWPAPERRPPTNTRLVVTYQGSVTSPWLPALGPNLALLDADGTPIAFAIEVIELSIAQVFVVMRPAAPLDSDHTYQIADRLPVPCDGTLDQCALTAEATVFATFTTAATADVEPPTFGGVTSLTREATDSCHGGGCCSDYVSVPANLGWSAGVDDVAGSDLRYNVYRLAGGAAPPVLAAALVDATTFRGYQACSGSTAAPMVPGSYIVRAVDWAGHEDTNTASRPMGDACARSGLSCAVRDPRASDLPDCFAIAAAAALAYMLARRKMPSG